MPCHLEIDYSDPDWLKTQFPTADYCAGTMIFFRNFLKRPRRAELQALYEAVKSSRHVFSTPREFMEHHGKGGDPDAMAAEGMWPYGEEDQSELR